jgi:hypothetical protein
MELTVFSILIKFYFILCSDGDGGLVALPFSSPHPEWTGGGSLPSSAA